MQYHQEQLNQLQKFEMLHQQIDNLIYYDNIINMVYSLGEEKRNAESVRRMAYKAHFSRKEHD